MSDGVLPVSGMRLAPSIQFEFPHVKFKARGSAFVSEQALQLADGIVSGTFTSPTVYGVRAEMIGNASRAVDDRSLGSDQVDVQTRVHLQFRQRAGLWFGGGVARPWRVAVGVVGEHHRRRRLGQDGRCGARPGCCDIHCDVHQLFVHEGRVGERYRQRSALMRDGSRFRRSERTPRCARCSMRR